MPTNRIFTASAYCEKMRVSPCLCAGLADGLRPRRRSEESNIRDRQDESARDRSEG